MWFILIHHRENYLCVYSAALYKLYHRILKTLNRYFNYCAHVFLFLSLFTKDSINTALLNFKKNSHVMRSWPKDFIQMYHFKNGKNMHKCLQCTTPYSYITHKVFFIKKYIYIYIIYLHTFYVNFN